MSDYDLEKFAEYLRVNNFLHHNAPGSRVLALEYLAVEPAAQPIVERVRAVDKEQRIDRIEARVDEMEHRLEAKDCSACKALKEYNSQPAPACETGTTEYPACKCPSLLRGTCRAGGLCSIDQPAPTPPAPTATYCGPIVEKPLMSDSAPAIAKQFTRAINRACEENKSNTPDFILGETLAAVLDALHRAINSRDKWYSISPSPGMTHTPPALDVEKVLREFADTLIAEGLLQGYRTVENFLAARKEPK
jgi:hypothetical protein